MAETKHFQTFYSAGYLAQEIERELANWHAGNKVKRLWTGDAGLWTNQDENQWMGWLDLPANKTGIVAILTLATELRKIKTEDIVLLGMGGSSLCPAMFAEIFERVLDYPRLHILDSTHPAQIFFLEKKIDLEHTIFIVSSKSGTTLEATILLDYFYQQTGKVCKEGETGRKFIAITDPGTPLEMLAKGMKFRKIFYGIRSVGGRYAAFSNFGMVPLGLMGIDVTRFLDNANSMREACANTKALDNPGVLLGIILGVAAKNGKDKVTLIVSPPIKALGAWLEQLIAESTGKDGKGLIPVDQEPLGEPTVYDKDRVFVYISLDHEEDRVAASAVQALEKAGFIVIRLQVADKMHLGMELYRWEIAVAVAGSILGIHPFNQPDVEESKKLAVQLTRQYEEIGEFKQSRPFYTENGISLYTDETILQKINGYLTPPHNLESYCKAFLQLAHPHDYVVLAAFIPMLDEYLSCLQKTRMLICDATHLATCLGFGPRFLHSTGQNYKGGPDNSLIFQLTADITHDISIPSHSYSFGLVVSAQAHADFNILLQRKKNVLGIHLRDIKKGLTIFHESLVKALNPAYSSEEIKGQASCSTGCRDQDVKTGLFTLLDK